MDINIPEQLKPARAFIEMQASYWRPAPAERATLARCGVAALSWTERLRLHHLACIEWVHQSKSADDDIIVAEDETPTTNEEAELASKTASLLMASDSPFRPRHTLVWHGIAGVSKERDADQQGLLRNASLTHLGCLEAITIDANDRPTGIVFIPLDDIRGVLLARPSVFRAAKILYEEGRPDQIVRLPLLYGLSWFTGKPYDTDGTMTHFCCNVRLPEARIGIGIGHQDLFIAPPSAALVGIGSVGELAMALDVTDPRFEQRCRARGIDPDKVRR